VALVPQVMAETFPRFHFKTKEASLAGLFSSGSRVFGVLDVSSVHFSVGHCLSRATGGETQDLPHPKAQVSLREREQPDLHCTCCGAGSECCVLWQEGGRCTDEERGEEGSTAGRLEQTCIGLCSGVGIHV